VRFVLTTTSLPTVVSLSVIVVACEGRSNHHNITYNGIDGSYCIVVRAVITTAILPRVVTLSVIVLH